MNKLIFLIVALFCFNNSFSQNYNWKNVNLQGMGFVTGILVHPTEKDVIFCRTDVGGVYRWNAPKKSWEPVTDGQIPSYGVEGIAIDPVDANIVYATIDKKLYQSTDRGTTWYALPNFPAVNMNGNGQYRFSGKRLVVDPNNNGSVLFVVTRQNGLQISQDKGLTWQSIAASELPFGNQTASGFYGQTFVAVDKNSGSATTNSSVVYVGVQGMGVYKSEDGGTTWNLLSNGPDVSYKPVSGCVGADGSLYVTYNTAKDEWANGAGKVYKYTESNGLTDITPTNNNKLGFSGIDTDPNDPNKVITFQWMYGNSNGIHYSTTAGNTWRQIPVTSVTQPKWFPNWSMWSYAGHIMFDPFTPNKVYLTSGFGVFISDDITKPSPVWYTEMQGLEEFVIGQVHCPPVKNGSDVISLQQDQIAMQVNYKDEVPDNLLIPGDFGVGTGLDYCIADPKVIAIVGSDQTNGALVAKHRFSIDGGITWNPFGSIPPTASNGNIAISSTNSENWVWVPRHNDGAKTLPFYSSDQGKTWIKCTGIPNVDNGATHFWAQSIYLQADKVNGSNFYYYMVTDGVGYGVLYRSEDGGASFKKVFTGLPSNYQCKLKAMPGKAGNLFFYIKDGDLSRSMNSGTSFSKMAGITKMKGIGFGKAIAPSTAITIYLAANYKGVDGIFRSTDDGQTWTGISDGNIPFPIITDVTGDLRYENIVYLATGGRGIIYGNDGAIPQVGVTKIELSRSEISIQVDEEQLLDADISPENASNPRFSWNVVNKNVATISGGVVTGKAIGKTSIIVTSKDGLFTDTCIVNVTSATQIKTSQSRPLQIFPNPLNIRESNSLTLAHIDSRNAYLSIADMSGKIIGQKYFSNINGNSIEYSLPTSMKPGIYLVFLDTKVAVKHEKLVIE
jgi:xyloglucan-specific exo-beta-1,4-glucanase